MSEAEEYAKAVRSVADFGTKALDVSEKVGGFFAKVFKEPIQEVSGLITDKLKFIRWRRLVQMADEVDKILSERGVRETRGVQPKLAIPIFEAGTLEDDASLQSLWSHLLANAMDPQFNGEIRYGFIDMIKNITGVEASILSYIYNNRDGYINKKKIIEIYDIDSMSCMVSIYNLLRIQCIIAREMEWSAMIPKDNNAHVTTLFRNIDIFCLTPLGQRFVEACIK